MSYRIVYESAQVNKTNIRSFPINKRRFGLWGVTILAVLSLCWAGWNQTNIHHYLLPGDPDITSAAFENLLEDIRNGKSLPDAVSVFCKEIVSNAKLE